MKWFALVCLFASACASRDLRTNNDLGVEWWEGPPCHVEVKDGKKLVLDARSPKRCVINAPVENVVPAPET